MLHGQRVGYISPSPGFRKKILSYMYYPILAHYREEVVGAGGGVFVYF